ncbi:MAG TPA: dTDP-4-dehydrorhamnose 3,5-epimerase [Pyrinomonadaceae bacterium]|nr:dTDP-4-dehydrorhamnose 3,5-epimerase [Pyrinomonadaceae bacterium]
MIFTETALKGAFIIEPELIEDERGFFARTWTDKEFGGHGLNPRIAQGSIAFNKRRGTIRGMHYQIPPHAEAKLVRCTAGAIYDIIIDLREDSSSRYQWLAVELTAKNRLMIYIPEGFAHGYQTLEDSTEVLYQISNYYHPESARGFRFDDPGFVVKWPLPVSVISERDRSYADFEREKK